MSDPRALIEECRAALAEELSAWDIDPPLHHVKQAHDKCVAWLAAPSPSVGADGLPEQLRAMIEKAHAYAPDILKADDRNEATKALHIVTDALNEALETIAALASRPVGDGGADTDAARDVLAERRRQVEAEGWTPEHDDEHADASMAIAAAVYCLIDARPYTGLGMDAMRLTYHMNWDTGWLKRSGPRRNLVKAGALILAEIERLDRAALTAGTDTAEGG